MDKKERFQLAKKNVKRRFPKAQTVIDSTGKFYVAQDGKDICNKELYKAVKRGASLEELNLIKEVKHTTTIFDAWLQAESMVTVNRVIESNTERFSDEKVINKNLEE
jgi:predicted RND superfamily exporter protein